MAIATQTHKDTVNDAVLRRVATPRIGASVAGASLIRPSPGAPRWRLVGLDRARRSAPRSCGRAAARRERQQEGDQTRASTASASSAERCRPTLDASRKLLAIHEGIVAAGRSRDQPICGAVADDQRDGDRLAERPAETEHRRADDAAARVREDRDPHRLVPGGAERQRRLAEVAWHDRDDLAA